MAAETGEVPAAGLDDGAVSGAWRIPKEAEKIIREIQAQLTPDLLRPEYARKVEPSDPNTSGHCFVATEALYHLWGKANGYYPCSHGKPGNTHWWLRNRAGEIIDPTADSRTPHSYPYDKGRAIPFRTTLPSVRTADLLQRLQSCQSS